MLQGIVASSPVQERRGRKVTVQTCFLLFKERSEFDHWSNSTLNCPFNQTVQQADVSVDDDPSNYLSSLPYISSTASSKFEGTLHHDILSREGEKRDIVKEIGFPSCPSQKPHTWKDLVNVFASVSVSRQDIEGQPKTWFQFKLQTSPWVPEPLHAYLCAPSADLSVGQFDGMVDPRAADTRKGGWPQSWWDHGGPPLAPNPHLQLHLRPRLDNHCYHHVPMRSRPSNMLHRQVFALEDCSYDLMSTAAR